MKKTILAALAAMSMLMIVGCTSSNSNCAFTSDKKTVSAFNDESYVWEGFIFTTNRVNGVK